MNYGSSAGATVGSVIPGVGTVIGSSIGGIIDSFAHLLHGMSTQQEFQQWILPIIYPEAQKAQCAVYVYWFGEITGITPSGQIVHFGTFPNLTSGYAALDEQNDYYETYGEFQNLDSSNHYRGGQFTHHGSGILERYESMGYQASENPIINAVQPIASGVASVSPVLIVGLIGAGLLALYLRRK